MLSDTISVALPAGPVAARLQSRCSTSGRLWVPRASGDESPRTNAQGEAMSREELRAEEA